MRYTISELTEGTEADIYRDIYVTYRKHWAHIVRWVLAMLSGKNIVIVR